MAENDRMGSAPLVAVTGVLGICALAQGTNHSLPIAVVTGISVAAYIFTNRCLPDAYPYLIKAGLFGKDINKVGTPVVPESGGVVCGTVFLVSLFVFLPAPFLHKLALTRLDATVDHVVGLEENMELIALIVSSLSICCMVLLGFADDVLDLKWRVKFTLPFFATLPLLMVYYISYNHTSVLLPSFIQDYFDLDTFLDFGIFYYVFMVIVGIFSTNAINIYAGVNGLEVGQSVVIGIFVAINAIIQIGRNGQRVHYMAFYIIQPFIGVSLALLRHNWFPSHVFVGDTYCYFAGMTLYVIGILSHTSKTIMLFFVPQWINFLYSLPQLFKLTGPCPRHRMPRLNKATGKVEASKFSVKKDSLKPLGRTVLRLFRMLRLVSVSEDEEGMLTVNNFTLINFVLVKLGPMREDVLCVNLLLIQALSGILGLLIRYCWAGYFYTVIE